MPNSSAMPRSKDTDTKRSKSLCEDRIRTEWRALSPIELDSSYTSHSFIHSQLVTDVPQWANVCLWIDVVECKSVSQRERHYSSAVRGISLSLSLSLSLFGERDSERKQSFFLYIITGGEHIHRDQKITFWLLTIVHGNYGQMIRDTDA